jgi:site-specific DNA recombinase
VSRRAGLYLRISKDRNDDRLAVTRQRADGLALIERRGWELVDTYVDNDTSAKRGGRRRGGSAPTSWAVSPDARSR